MHVCIKSRGFVYPPCIEALKNPYTGGLHTHICTVWPFLLQIRVLYKSSRDFEGFLIAPIQGGLCEVPWDFEGLFEAPIQRGSI